MYKVSTRQAIVEKGRPLCTIIRCGAAGAGVTECSAIFEYNSHDIIRRCLFFYRKKKHVWSYIHRKNTCSRRMLSKKGAKFEKIRISVFFASRTNHKKHMHAFFDECEKNAFTRLKYRIYCVQRTIILRHFRDIF